jgi:hypothetical protein
VHGYRHLLTMTGVEPGCTQAACSHGPQGR